MHVKYIKDHHPSLVMIDHPPASWQRLLDVREFVELCIRWSLHKGMVDFWHNIWCGQVSLATELGVYNPPHFLVGEFYTSQGWNVSRLKQWVPSLIVQRITQVQFYPDQDDFMVWLPSHIGNFMVASTWG